MFTRTVTTTLTTTAVPSWAPSRHFEFTVTITHTTGDEEWLMSLIDYDGSCGALAYFDNEHQAIRHLDDFIKLAFPAYEAKYAKYGSMPTCRMMGEVLVLELVLNA